MIVFLVLIVVLILILILLFPKRQKNTFAKCRSHPQERKEGPRSVPYILVNFTISSVFPLTEQQHCRGPVNTFVPTKLSLLCITKLSPPPPPPNSHHQHHNQTLTTTTTKLSVLCTTIWASSLSPFALPYWQ